MNLFDLISAAIPRPAILRDRDEEYRQLTANLKKASTEMDAFLKSISGYVYHYDYSRQQEKWKEAETDAEKKSRTFRLVAGNEFQTLRKNYQQYLLDEKTFSEKIQENNNAFLKSKVSEAYDLIGNVEGRKLDFQQMSCIVKDARSHLVIAGAGTGKTTTILGKVKYLLATGQVRPEELLILSFTNAAASEMKNRLMAETSQSIYVATFHKLGYDIIRRADKITPKIFNGNLNQFITSAIASHMSDPAYSKQFLSYILYNRIQQKSEFEFESSEEYQDFLEINPPTTILEEPVKSYGEMNIANFLASHGIRYEYEAEYPIDTRTEERGQYYPDFFLPDYNIYIEYFGIDKEGHVPDWFESDGKKSPSEVYQEGMKWKRELHREHDTFLLECYAYENMDGTLLKNLEKRLREKNVSFSEIPLADLLEKGGQKEKNVINTVAEVMATVISLAKSRKYSSDGLISLCKENVPKELALASLTAPVMKDYEEHLSYNGAVDFTDMLNRAEELTRTNAFVHKFKYVIVDEYQDLSSAQYRLLLSMRNQADYSLFCVGDDWQSIYRFAGSDIGYILNFDRYWGDSERSYIETTYRFSQRLIDISSSFVMKNPNQLKKYICSGNDTEKMVLGEISGYTDKATMQFVEARLKELPKDSTIYFIGRYQFDVDQLRANSNFNLNYDNVNQVVRISLASRSDLKMTFYTAHKSKGLQADYVFIINNRATHMGFPSKVQNPPLVELLLEQADQYPDAEERRLFYVALTRAKKKAFLVTTGKNVSSFARELEEAYADEIKQEAWTCPLCGGKLQKRNGKYGEFYGCSNYSSNGCKFIRCK